MEEYALRLKPGSDLKNELQRFVRENDIQSGVVLTCVGSLQKARLRMANSVTIRDFDGHYEIVSLVGTLCQDGLHLHMSISDENGVVYGGHVKDGCIVYTTAEVALGDLDGMSFSRKMDDRTGYKELKISE